MLLRLHTGVLRSVQYRGRCPGRSALSCCAPSKDGGLFAVPLREVDLGVAQAHALDLDQGCLELGEGLRVLARGPHHELMAAAQHDGPSPAIEAFDDGPRDCVGRHQCLGRVDSDAFHPCVILKSSKCLTLYGRVFCGGQHGVGGELT